MKARPLSTVLWGAVLCAACGVGAGDAGENGGGGGGGGRGEGADSAAGGCVAIEDIEAFLPLDDATFRGSPSPALGGPDPDEIQLSLPMTATGHLDLAMPESGLDCENGQSVCLVALQDAPTGEDVQAVTYVAASGALDLGRSSPPFYIRGSITEAVLVEVTLDPLDSTIVAVEGGRCLSLARFDFDIERPTEGWSCNPGFYDEADTGASLYYCDCACGAPDPDCEIPTAKLTGCEDGQTCGADGACAGTPTDWTCAAERYGGGPGDGCDCGCGAADPDCALPGEAVVGCEEGEVCGEGRCLPPTWTCDPRYFATGKPNDCDCGCGAPDPDCPSGSASECDYCLEAGSCATGECPANIVTDDNASCT